VDALELRVKAREFSLDEALTKLTPCEKELKQARNALVNYRQELSKITVKIDFQRDKIDKVLN